MQVLYTAPPSMRFGHALARALSRVQCVGHAHASAKGSYVIAGTALGDILYLASCYYPRV
jgi:hypothetical protein